VEEEFSEVRSIKLKPVPVAGFIWGLFPDHLHWMHKGGSNVRHEKSGKMLLLATIGTAENFLCKDRGVRTKEPDNTFRKSYGSPIGLDYRGGAAPCSPSFTRKIPI
jgi:hypothetical protein